MSWLTSLEVRALLEISLVGLVGVGGSQDQAFCISGRYFESAVLQKDTCSNRINILSKLIGGFML